MRFDPRAALFFVIVAVAGLVGEALRVPAVVSANAPDAAFSGARAFAQLEVLLRERLPHPVGSPANAEVRRRIVRRLRELGYASDVQTVRSCARGPCVSLHNLVIVVPDVSGQRPSVDHPAVMLTAHYDSVPTGPGVADDGAGVATLLEIARAIRHRPRFNRPLILLFSDGEEHGLLGAQAFVAQHPLARAVDVVINLEARGTGGPSMMFETAGDNAALIQTMSESVPRPVTTSLFALVYRKMPNDTDLSVYEREGMRGYNFAFIRHVENYHTPRDDLDHLDRGSLQHHGDNALSLLDKIGRSSATGRDGHAVWFDVLGRFVVWWPLSWTVPFALSALALLGIFCRRVHVAGRFQAAHWRQAAWSAAKMSSAMLCLVGLLAWVVFLGGLRVAPPVMLSALATAALVCVWGMRCLSSQSYPLRLAAYWAIHALLGLLTALVAPEASYLFVVPAAVAAVAFFVLRPEESSSRGWRATIVTSLPLLATAVLWLPMVIGFRDALDVMAMPFVAAAAVPVFGSLIPVMPLRGREAWKVARLLLLVFCVGLFF